MRTILLKLASVAPLAFVIALAGCNAITGAGDADHKFDGCYDNSCVSAPVRVPVVPALASLTTISSHTCGLSTTGDAWCWGDNTLGELGDGTDQPRNAPVKVAGGLSFTAISAGANFTCAVARDGTAYCWGTNAIHQLGQPSTDLCLNGQVQCSRTPLAIAGHTFTAITTGLRHACAIDTAGDVWCWGFNFLGEAGSTTYNEPVTAPLRVSGGVHFASLSAGDTFNCGLTTTGRAMCFGSGSRGELGRAVPVCSSVAGFENTCSPTPVAVGTSSTYRSISVGFSHSCGLTAAGVAECWGDNGQGQLGTGNFVNGGPYVAQGSMTWTNIAATGPATCGTPTTGPSVCWGLNLFGLLGVGTRIDLSTTPLAIAGGQRYTAWAGGQYHVCALTADGAAWCWGSGRLGELGTGPMAP